MKQFLRGQRKLRGASRTGIGLALLVPKLHLGTHPVLEAELRFLLGLLKTKCNFGHRRRSQVQLGNEGTDAIKQMIEENWRQVAPADSFNNVNT